MLGRHLKIGAGSRIVMRESVWDKLLARTTGSVKVGANAVVVIVPDTAPADIWHTEVQREQGA